jgi:hypothetical protein
MPILRRVDNHTTIGPITDEDVGFLRDQLEEEDLADRDYYIDRATLELLEDAGAPPALLALLEGALGREDGMDIAWRESPPAETPPGPESPYR